MFVKVSKIEVKKMLEKCNKAIEICMCDKRLDCNSLVNGKLAVDVLNYAQLKEIIEKDWVQFCGKESVPQLCIWTDEGEEYL